MTVILADSFDYPAGTTLQSTGFWTNATGDFRAFQGAVAGNINSEYGNYLVAGSYGNDVDVSVDLKFLGSAQSVDKKGISARFIDTSNLYWVWYNQGTGIQLYKAVAGAWTQLGSTYAYTLAAGGTMTLRLKVEGSSLQVYLNGGGSPVIAATDSALATGACGLRGYHSPGQYVAGYPTTSGIFWDNFQVDKIGGVAASELIAPHLPVPSVLHAPAVAPGAISISSPKIAAAMGIYAPSLTLGELFLFPAIIQSGVALRLPTITAVVAVAVPLLVSTSQLRAPAVARVFVPSDGVVSWPAALPWPIFQSSGELGSNLLSRELQSGRRESRRFGSGAPDVWRVQLRVRHDQAQSFLDFYERVTNMGLNWFAAPWLSHLGYEDHMARIVGYPSRKGVGSLHSDFAVTIHVKPAAKVWPDTTWPS